MWQGYGVTVPFEDLPLDRQRDRIERLALLGYTDLWSSETDRTDAFVPLALASVWAPTLRLGTAIVPSFTRGPACLAQSAATMAAAAPGRFALGIGTSSNVIVDGWNGIPFERPYQRTRDVVRFLRTALTGEKVREDFDTFRVDGFRLGIPRTEPVPILLAALREGMLRLAGRAADGVIVNWLAATDVPSVAQIVSDAAPSGAPEREVVARIFVMLSQDEGAVRAAARRMIAAHLNVPVYAAFHEWLGRGPALEEMWHHWRRGDREAAVAAVPDHLVDELFVWGSPEQCRAHIERYTASGVTTPVLALLLSDRPIDDALEALAPR